VALDTKLITVPQIDFKTYPEGIPGDNGADITAGFTIQSARDLAPQLRLGALPIQLDLISTNRHPSAASSAGHRTHHKRWQVVPGLTLPIEIVQEITRRVGSQFRSLYASA
jgi:hypothetical protein